MIDAARPAAACAPSAAAAPLQQRVRHAVSDIRLGVRDRRHGLVARRVALPVPTDTVGDANDGHVANRRAPQHATASATHDGIRMCGALLVQVDDQMPSAPRRRRVTRTGARERCRAPCARAPRASVSCAMRARRPRPVGQRIEHALRLGVQRFGATTNRRQFAHHVRRAAPSCSPCSPSRPCGTAARRVALSSAVLNALCSW